MLKTSRETSVSLTFLSVVLNCRWSVKFWLQVPHTMLDMSSHTLFKPRKKFYHKYISYLKFVPTQTDCVHTQQRSYSSHFPRLSNFAKVPAATSLFSVWERVRERERERDRERRRWTYKPHHIQYIPNT